MDYAITNRRALIASAVPKQSPAQVVDAMQKRLADTLERKRIRAINYLGSRWVLHPEYDSARHAHHNPSHKASAVLSVFLHLSGAIANGRV